MKIKMLATLILVLCLSKTALAHPPTAIKLSYNNKTKMLKAVLTHPVDNAESHYLNKIDIGLNGKEILEHKIKYQDNKTTQTVKYHIPDAKPGDTLSVEGYCNKSGKLTKEIKIK